MEASQASAPYIPPIAVKVMRVSAPTLAPRLVPAFETVAEGAPVLPAPHSVATMEASVWDAAQASMAQGSDAAFVQAPVSMRDSSYTDQVLLPASFGTVGTYTLLQHLRLVAVGETFHAVISATNTSTRPLTGVRIRVELHSEGTEKFAPTSFQLADVPGPVALAPGAQVTAVVRHGIEALATHALVCRIRSDQPTAQGLKEHWLAKYVRSLVDLTDPAGSTALLCRCRRLS